MRELWGANKAQRLAYRWYPKGSMEIRHPDGLGVVYVSQFTRAHTNGSEGWQLVAYRGTAGKPEFNYSYKTREFAEKKVEEWFTALLAHKVRVLEYRKDANKPHTLKVGDIITNSWGYDQTNVDWYRITRVSEHFVWLREIAAHVVEDGFMSGPSQPHIDTTNPDPSKWGFQDCKGPEVKHKATGESVCMKYGSGSKWDGKPRYCSWYA